MSSGRTLARGGCDRSQFVLGLLWVFAVLPRFSNESWRELAQHQDERFSAGKRAILPEVVVVQGSQLLCGRNDAAIVLTTQLVCTGSQVLGDRTISVLLRDRLKSFNDQTTKTYGPTWIAGSKTASRVEVIYGRLEVSALFQGPVGAPERPNHESPMPPRMRATCRRARRNARVFDRSARCVHRSPRPRRGPSKRQEVPRPARPRRALRPAARRHSTS